MTLVDCPWCGEGMTARELQERLGTGSTCPCCSMPLVIRLNLAPGSGLPPYDVSRGPRLGEAA